MLCLRQMEAKESYRLTRYGTATVRRPEPPAASPPWLPARDAAAAAAAAAALSAAAAGGGAAAAGAASGWGVGPSSWTAAVNMPPSGFSKTTSTHVVGSVASAGRGTSSGCGAWLTTNESSIAVAARSCGVRIA